ncbi:MAG: hypothetical protein J5X22_22320 [Candidatus Accumulibacter sp.]|uniref:Uncharacterized protein n=1 Tax=Candidatus Accumulibacter cognatus TaxID=2954383 RepID=A0A080M8E9_9PROT|nr:MULTISPECIES: hypothetical protein [Candidatus Accumulibacter]KFB76745.1 MAG: hypothetical protein AW06_002222 [Candidatus Accumulibacter cognatus]MBO3713111.1 hypothetical protein [Accumulibacter sp.]
MTKYMAPALALLVALSGCANLTGDTGSNDRGLDGIPCVGTVVSTAEGLAESTNSSLLGKAQMPTGKGGVCSAKVFAATAPVVLYRVFDASKPYTKFGVWWSLKRPGNSKVDYRSENAICPEWSNLDRLTHCEIRPGTQVVLGTTQSAICADGSLFAKTAAIQVFVPNDGRDGIIHVGACAEDSSWP